AMIIAGVEVFAGHMRNCLVGGGTAPAEATRARLAANLRHLRDTYDALLKLDLPSQPLSIVEKVIFDYRVHGMTVFLQRAHKRVKGLGEKETWKIEEFSDYGAITNLPQLLQSHITEALSSIHKCVASAGRRESALFADGGEATVTAQKLTQQTLLAFVDVLRELALDHDGDQDFNNSSLSVALDQRLDESREQQPRGAAGHSWQRRLLVAGANAQYTRRAILPAVADAFHQYGFPKPTQALQVSKEALKQVGGDDR
ncbi:hypothetical protein ACJJTC_011234, partial [Scirpophaga incertulas]